jgi:hypothetical protein
LIFKVWIVRTNLNIVSNAKEVALFVSFLLAILQ